MEELVSCGADVTIRDHSGRTPADVALNMGNIAVYKMLDGLPNSVPVTANSEARVNATLLMRLITYGVPAASLFLFRYFRIAQSRF